MVDNQFGGQSGHECDIERVMLPTRLKVDEEARSQPLTWSRQALWRGNENHVAGTLWSALGLGLGFESYASALLHDCPSMISNSVIPITANMSPHYTANKRDLTIQIHARFTRY